MNNVIGQIGPSGRVRSDSNLSLVENEAKKDTSDVPMGHGKMIKMLKNDDTGDVYIDSNGLADAIAKKFISKGQEPHVVLPHIAMFVLELLDEVRGKIHV